MAASPLVLLPEAPPPEALHPVWAELAKGRPLTPEQRQAITKVLQLSVEYGRYLQNRAEMCLAAGDLAGYAEVCLDTAEMVPGCLAGVEDEIRSILARP